MIRWIVGQRWAPSETLHKTLAAGEKPAGKKGVARPPTKIYFSAMRWIVPESGMVLLTHAVPVFLQEM